MIERSREIYSSLGQPEEPRLSAEREEKGIVGEYRSQNLAEYLNEIDFGLLEQKFREIVGRCGVNPQGMNFVPKERVFSNEYNPVYYSGINLVQIPTTDTWPFSGDFMHRMSIERYGSERMQVLAFVIHEQVHAASRTMHITPVENSFAYSQVGYQRNFLENSPVESKFRHKKNSEFRMIFRELNEGITEKLAREVMVEYLEEKEFSKTESETFKEGIKSRKTRYMYTTEVDFVERLVERLAEKNGLTPKVVWEALVRGLFEGETFESKEVQELFAEAFDKSFLKKLSLVDSSKKMENLVKKYLEQQESK